MTASLPPVVFTTAGTAAWSVVRYSSTVPVVTVLAFRAPFGKKKSAVTAESRGMPAAPLAGWIVVTVGLLDSIVRFSRNSIIGRRPRATDNLLCLAIIALTGPGGWRIERWLTHDPLLIAATYDRD